MKYEIDGVEHLSLNTGKKCTLCDNKHHAKGYCGKHYNKIFKDRINQRNRESEEHRSYKRQWIKAKREAGLFKEYDKIRRKRASNKYIRVKSQAKARGIPFLLTQEEYINITSGKCHYCGTRINVGVDRLNNFGPYSRENCVPCCVPDNLLKGQKYDDQETMVMVKALNEFRFNRDKEITKTGCIKIPIRVFEDYRGFFTETYSNKILSSIGQSSAPDQMNCSVSKYDVLRGMHYNNVNPQSKLVRVIRGEIIDCVIDLRENSPTYGIMECFYLSTKNCALYIPKGFAHGFWSLEEDTQVLYSCWGNFDPSNDKGINPMDHTFSFPWLRYDRDYIVSDKDKNWEKFDDSHFVPENLSEFV